MAFRNNVPQASWRLAKIALGGIVLTGLACPEHMPMPSRSPLPTVDKVELDRYLGVWYEVARKPAFFQKMCLQCICNLYLK